MTVPCITYTDLVEKYLKPNGYIVENPQLQDFWGGHNRIIIKKGEYSFPFQYRNKYFYLQIVHLFNQLEISVPEEHQRCYDQHTALQKKETSKGRSNKEKREGDNI